MKTVKKYPAMLVTAACAALLLSACQNLDLHYEGGLLDDDQVKETVEAIPDRVNSAVNGMYVILGESNGYFGSGRHDDFGYPAMAMGQDMNSSDMVNIVSGYDWISVALEWSDRTPTYANPRMRLGLPYKVLYATKEVLAAIPDDAENAELKSKRGQAKAIRAWAYLSLAPYFQFKYKGNEDKLSVPLLKDGVDPRNNPRVPLRELYEENIIPDLTNAIADLEGFVRPNKGIIDQKVAYGLRARAYLYMEEWAKAAEDADKAMAGYTPYAISELTAPGFNNAEDHAWMWGLLLPSDVINGLTRLAWPAHLCSFSGLGYAPGTGCYRQINTLLWAKIPANDVRRKWWLNESKQSSYLDGLTWTDGGTTYTGQEIVDANISNVKEPMPAYTNVKFGQRAGVGSSYNYGDWCMMRVEEMILIKAEATAKAGNLAGGKQILEDFVRNYRQPDFLCTVTSVDDFSNEVWLQRRIELWGEGFAMADVMRLGKNVVRYISGKATNVPEDYRFNISSSDPWLLLRFVQAELTNNPAVVQNTGGVQPKQGEGSTLRDGVTD